MKKIKSLNQSFVSELFVEKLDEKADLSYISAIDLVTENINVVDSVAEGCDEDCTVKIDGCICEDMCVTDGWGSNDKLCVAEQVTNPGDLSDPSGQVVNPGWGNFVANLADSKGVTVEPRAALNDAAVDNDGMAYFNSQNSEVKKLVK